MNFINDILSKLKGVKTYVSAALTVIAAIIYAVTTWDIAGAAGFIGLSAQAAALRSAIGDFKKGVDEKFFGQE